MNAFAGAMLIVCTFLCLVGFGKCAYESDNADRHLKCAETHTVQECVELLK